MQFQYIPYIWPLIISASITLSLGLYAIIRQHHSKYAISFIISMMIVSIWSIGNSLEMSGTNFFTKLLWTNIQYFAYCYSPPALLALCMRFTGYDRWLRDKKFLWLLLLPTIIFILVWTDKLHGLVRYQMHLDTSGAFPVIAKEYGPAFFVHAIYEHIINSISLILLVMAVIHRKTVYQKQAIILLIGASFIIFPNFLYIMGLSPIHRFDITPIFFAPAGVLMAWAIFRYKMFDLMPLARATVIENMNAGVMVLDLQDRIMDINPAFEKIMGTTIKLASGREAKELYQNIPEFSCACANKSTVHIEFPIKTNKGIRIYEAIFSPLSNSSGVLMGRLVMIDEITEKKKIQQQYLEQQRKLAATNEKNRMTRDLHDNLGQVLGFINLQAQGIRQELVTAGVNTVNAKLDRLVEVTQTAHDEMRSYIKGARNISSYNNEFLESLRNDILQFEQRSEISTNFFTTLDLADIDLSPQIQLHLLNITKEALNNVQKHSDANYVNLTLSLEKEKMLLSIDDDGRGFCISDQHDVPGNAFGLSIMKERAMEIGAELSINSAPGSGCHIILALPISQERGNFLETYTSR